MKNVRYLDQKEDILALGLDPEVVAVREDGRQSQEGVAGSEVWYFDAVLDDGTKFVGGFRNKPFTGAELPDDQPHMVITLTKEDGTVYADTATYSVETSHFSKEQCDLAVGPHTLKGDLLDYSLHIEPIVHDEDVVTIDGLEKTGDSIGVDLYFHAEVEPYRHGAGRAIFGSDDQFSSWLCIPKMTVKGTIMINGESKEVTGIGYHDHRCMAINDLKAWHHWLWGRQTFEDYTVAIYDLVTAKQYGFVEIPLFVVYDKAGKIIFDNYGEMKREILEMSYEEVSRKEYPKHTRYHFEYENMVIDYNLNWQDILEVREMYWTMPEAQRAVFDQMEIQISYNRYYANGELTVTKEGKSETHSGKMIYEFAYVGKPDDGAHLQLSKK